MSRFRNEPRPINGFFVIVALGAFDLVMIGLVIVDVWRLWGMR